MQHSDREERQPSISTSIARQYSTTRGLTTTRSPSLLRGPGAVGSVLYTNSRLLRPTCGAAIPTPLAAYITRNISEHSRRSSSSNTATSAFLPRRTGCGYSVIVSAVPSKRGGLAYSSNMAASNCAAIVHARACEGGGVVRRDA
eukprot:2137660-Prymnesium_polylepis.1